MKTKIFSTLILSLIGLLIFTSCTTAEADVKIENPVVDTFSESLEDENIWSEDDIYSKLGFNKEDFTYNESLMEYKYNEKVEYLGYEFDLLLRYDESVGFGNFAYEAEIRDEDYATVYAMAEDLFAQLDAGYSRNDKFIVEGVSGYDNFFEAFPESKTEEERMNVSVYPTAIWETEDQNVNVTLFLNSRYSDETGEFTNVTVRINYNPNEPFKFTDRTYMING